MTTPELSVLPGAAGTGIWKVESVPARVQGVDKRGRPRRYAPYWQALSLLGLAGVEPECGHHHTSHWDAHRCGVALWGAEGEAR